MSSIASSKRSLKEEMAKLLVEESKIDSELSQYFGMLRKGKSVSSKLMTFESMDISNTIAKVENSNPVFEAMLQDSKKLAIQVEEGKNLSDRLSGIVRRLDVMQIRSQQALACTEDIMNMKDCKVKLCAAIEEKNLSLAVSYIRQVHEIDVKAAKTSDDFEVILQKEAELKELVKGEFAAAIAQSGVDAQSNIDAVMALCPLLQTLGLESEARDDFLVFVEKSIFVAISADLVPENTKDEAVGYAQVLSGIFNAAFQIVQKYLPMVIQGMANSLGDVFFVRKLHARCEEQAGLVLKRYMRFRKVKEMAGFCASGGRISSFGATGSSASGTKQSQWSTAEVHSVMDELALLVQYCSKYSQYLKHICSGAEAITRLHIHIHEPNSSSSTANKVVVFPTSTAFARMQEDLVTKFYLVGESWLMGNGVRSALSRGDHGEENSLDECFFVLQKCGLRAIATADLLATRSVLERITELISSDLATHATEMLLIAAEKITSVLQDHITQYKRSILNTVTEGSAVSGGLSDTLRSATSISSGFKSALSMASTISTGSSTSASQANKDDIQFHHSGGFYFAGNGGTSDDPWRVAAHVEAFNLVELCARYAERLGKDLLVAARDLFMSEGGSAEGGKTLLSGSRSVDKCREDFEKCVLVFSVALRQGADKLQGTAQVLVRDIFFSILGRSGPFGGVRFDEPDSVFDNQPALNLMPKVLTLPFETLVNISTFGMSDRNRDLVVGLLADSCCDKCEQFVLQTSFSFAGALKLEEIVRALTALFSRFSTVPVRGKFSRLREILLVLTSEAGSGGANGLITDNFTQLTTNEVESFVALRVDLKSK